MRKALFLTKLRKHPTPHKDVTLSKRGIEPLRLCNTVYLRARRTSVSGVNPNGRQKMPAFFEGMGISFDTAVSRSLCYNKQFFAFKKVHQTRLISLNLLSQVSVLLRSLRSPTQNFDACGKGLHCSHNNYIPHLLRMTR